MTPRRGVALTTLAVWVGLLVAALLLGHRAATFGDLRTVVALDYVDRVQVSGGLDAGARGHEVVEVRWRQGFLRFSTLVVEERPTGAAGRALRDDEDVTAVLDEPVPDVLHGIDPTLEVTTGPALSGGWTVLGWDTPVGVDAVLLLAVAGTAWLLTTGPAPRRATRWGWLWLMLLLPVAGFLAFLLLSGVLSRRPFLLAARPALTGGRALALGLLLATLGYLVNTVLQR
jgi:hypothetical protein